MHAFLFFFFFQSNKTEPQSSYYTFHTFPTRFWLSIDRWTQQLWPNIKISDTYNYFTDMHFILCKCYQLQAGTQSNRNPRGPGHSIKVSGFESATSYFIFFFFLNTRISNLQSFSHPIFYMSTNMEFYTLVTLLYLVGRKKKLRNLQIFVHSLKDSSSETKTSYFSLSDTMNIVHKTTKCTRTVCDILFKLSITRENQEFR